MKIKFVTGGEECVCKGEGYLEHRIETIEGPLRLRTDCECVKAMGATLEHTGTWMAYAGELNRNGRVVPEEE